MAKAIAIMVGVIMGSHGLIGLFIEGQHMLIFNVDIALDVLYLVSAAILLFVGFVPVSALVVRGGSLLVAAALTLAGLLGMADDQLGGAAPTGLTLMDLVILFGLAAALVTGGVWPRAAEPIENFD
ncbi:hypothetical protein [Herbiconiux sp. L3-i23]|uniref:hypothetical protein n=1 Tax=Herbiconiux sp. L3-i23 TaxID=2905871 RepID=UPI002058F472|nr:hypothetical protein [Herbiconiux sp. L3-i23]BDI23635.1 hypothetical protein L3i23_24110 [Herbiconiux sp. L3-i23]